MNRTLLRDLVDYLNKDDLIKPNTHRRSFLYNIGSYDLDMKGFIQKTNMKPKKYKQKANTQKDSKKPLKMNKHQLSPFTFSIYGIDLF